VASDGTINVAYTDGVPPLAATPAGTGISFPSKKALKDAIVEAEQSISADTLLMILLGLWFKSDPQLTSVGLFRGKYVQIDLTGLLSTLAIK
jgi:hypothetical protein